MYKIILGSKSPRRVELLERINLKFEQVVFDAEEIWPVDMLPENVAIFLAELKAKAYHPKLNPNELLITADSIVIQGGQILGKPESAQQAEVYLSRLSDTTHKVITGVCLTTTQKTISFDESADVHCTFISSQEINFYIQNYRPYDKAGAYGIQEWLGLTKVKKITGTYSNIMGMPTAALYDHLSRHFPEYQSVKNQGE